MSRPLVVELFCGRCVGFDLVHEAHHGAVPDGCSLALQDVLTLHGSQFRHASAIVASPPCQTYSWMAMPFSRGKREAAWQRWERDSEFGDFHLNDLFDACFRVQREASEAAGRYIPMVVENVKGAQPWVGRARARFGSFYLWGDVDSIGGRVVARGAGFGDTLRPSGKEKVAGFNFHEYEKTGMPGRSFQSAAVQGTKAGGDWFGPGDVGKGSRFTSRDCGVEADGVKQAGLSGPAWFNEGAASLSSGSNARKAASALIAEIPPALARHFARVWHPGYRAAKPARSPDQAALIAT